MATRRFFNNTRLTTFLETNVVLNYGGNVEWLPPALFRSSCTMDVALFPFDRQKCPLIFSSSTYDKRDLIFTDVSYVYVDSRFTETEWHLEGCPGNMSTRFSETGETYSEIIFELYLTRLPLFWILNIIIPICLMFLLSNGVFYLPVDSGEKMTLSISILLGQTVFLFLGTYVTCRMSLIESS